MKIARRAEEAYVYDQGLEAGEQIGEHDGELNMLFKLVSDHTIDINTAAEKSRLTPRSLKRNWRKPGTISKKIRCLNKCTVKNPLYQFFTGIADFLILSNSLFIRPQ
ncbi:MAG: hypothetical protein MR945_03790 [Agathobacter sp.]|nr:hypothetical protein [Agathobacter sp.]